MSIPRALEQVGGLQTQYATSGYIGLWTRLRDFEKRALTAALEKKTVVQATLMRTTIHLVSARDYWPLAEAVRESRRARFLQTSKIDRLVVERAADRVRNLLATGPRRAAEVDDAAGADRLTRYGCALWVDLVRVPPSGTWEHRRADLLTTAEQWLGPSPVTFESGMDTLVRRYLGAFGPARVNDIGQWAGVHPRLVGESLARVRVVKLEDETGEELLDLPGAPLPDESATAPVRFLPTWDATLLVHARQAGVLSEDDRPRVFNVKTPHSVGTFLVNGSVAGTWKYVEGRVVPAPFNPLSREEREAVEREAASLTAFHG